MAAESTTTAAVNSGVRIFVTVAVSFAPFLLAMAVPRLLQLLGRSLGWYLRKKTEGRRSLLISLMNEEASMSQDKNLETKSTSSGEWQKVQKQDVDPDWAGIVGFFHPFCNAGGGGERVLWAAIRATQNKWPKAKCVVYTGDHEVTKDQILSRVKSRFNISLHPPAVTFLYLSKRDWVVASTWPRFTLLGQSLGSMYLAWDAFSLLVPDIFVDTMGYAFSLGVSKWLFPEIPTGAYVHYPTISTDMLESLDPDSKTGSQGVNAGQGVGIRGTIKKWYWMRFSELYSWVGSSIDVVMANSTWTRTHLTKLWGPWREVKDRRNPIPAIFPPCAVEELEQEIEISEESETKREKAMVYIAQFRPEKNHKLIVQSFAKFVMTGTDAAKGAKLILIGSVRDDHDSKRVYELRLLVNELHIKDRVEFQLDAPWPEILQWLQKASVGVNGMWNEHFGIGCVEYQAAGLISVVHNSGGPKLDIVVEVDGEPTGFHAETVDEFAEGYESALSVANPLAMRLRARQSAKRFTEGEFASKWLVQMDRLVAMTKSD
ncbi:GDP-Man:Man(3)GlcNAc(2)-PP-Dol alpha-1 [Emericellopsis cladophorae]|uniref:GDP-Man:Man(3)GlcNAc(2)-PP-Dol alpha-1,2-mannosyltransferase n=1 Tax=Emericellopsis cladophorae TaxID=2686198 RepID=A0A9Q0BEZ1_9HYPO|nr:GDP-Man:Man(3)GlcNAc(2)-PP-Dol alpha-1 [Emericellopsis cladophorae]KAI6781744.1 GDP-Man:Man(3)GlcNAc(2)-PP-Dol alpha-1 [Emericellopsis cladophorae]